MKVVKRRLHEILIPSLPPVSLTIKRNAKQILILGVLPSAMAFILFPRQRFFEFLGHHVSSINNWPYFIISLLLYLAGIAYSYVLGKTRVEAEFKSIFQCIIGILSFLLIVSAFAGLHQLAIEPVQSVSYLYLLILISAVCFSMLFILRFLEWFEAKLLKK